MNDYISKKTRALVAERAKYTCEYCLIPQQFSLFPFHVDHIVSRKHGGQTIPSNLAFCCGICNGNKGTDLGTFVDDFDSLIRFYNPRKDVWNEHFDLLNGAIYARSIIGEATIKILQLNEIERVLERKLLIEAGFL